MIKKKTQLLNRLQDFAGNLQKRTAEVTEHLYELEAYSHNTDTRLRNVFNELSLLANHQFIENRVYEDDEKALSAAKDDEDSSGAKSDSVTAQNLSELTHEQLEVSSCHFCFNLRPFSLS